MHEITLGEAEEAAVKEGVTAYESLLAKLADATHRNIDAIFDARQLTIKNMITQLPERSKTLRYVGKLVEFMHDGSNRTEGNFLPHTGARVEGDGQKS